MPYLRAKNVMRFSVLTRRVNHLDRKYQLDNTRLFGYTDLRRSGGLSVFVGLDFSFSLHSP